MIGQKYANLGSNILRTIFKNFLLEIGHIFSFVPIFMSATRLNLGYTTLTKFTFTNEKDMGYQINWFCFVNFKTVGFASI